MTSNKPKRIPRLEITQDILSLLTLALAEDVGAGDVTSNSTIPERQRGRARLFSREKGILCGVDVALAVMDLVDPRVKARIRLRDGAALEPGREVLTLAGSLRSILTAERLMLNFLQRLSGVATLTRRHVDALRAAGSAMDVVDTRKTTPLWRRLERHAVRVGGGLNHRFGLFDMYLIKNNHVDAAGSVRAALERVWKDNAGRKRPVAVEARNIDEVRQAVETGADLILLDNMRPAQIRRAAEIVGGRIKTEISGGVTLRRMPALAKLPIDRVSIGALTHSAPAVDLALHVKSA